MNTKAEAAKRFLEDADALLSLLQQIPDAGAEFRDSVGEKTKDMATWARKHQTVTPKMQSALANMRAGAEKWLRNRRDRP